MKRKITPTAERQLRWLDVTYGIRQAIDEWCKEIVATADKGERPLIETPLEDVLNGIGEATETSGLGSMAKALESIWNWIRRRTAKQRDCCLPKVFRGLSDGSVPVGVLAGYRIDLKEEEVTFLFFDDYSPKLEAEKGSDEPHGW
jgi:hypothetical protein